MRADEQLDQPVLICCARLREFQRVAIEFQPHCPRSPFPAPHAAAERHPPRPRPPPPGPLRPSPQFASRLPPQRPVEEGPPANDRLAIPAALRPRPLPLPEGAIPYPLPHPHCAARPTFQNVLADAPVR